jgi:hypothetical protein
MAKWCWVSLKIILLFAAGIYDPTATALIAILSPNEFEKERENYFS